MIEFLCGEHEINLDGWPTFTLVSSTPNDVFDISMSMMFCPKGDQDCEESWKISGEIGHTGQ